MAAFIHNAHFPREIRQHYYQRVHPLERFNHIELIQRYRFNSEGIQRITRILQEDICAKSNANNAIPPIERVCAALHFYATGCFQRTDGDTLNISQPSISRIVDNVSDALARRLPQYVHLPGEDERRRHMDVFFDTAGFPGIIGLIDGTQVKIQAPVENEDQFVNRKRYHSINVQVVMDPHCKIINLNAQWPGSVHDSRVLRESGLGDVLENGQGHLLGDSG